MIQLANQPTASRTSFLQEKDDGEGKVQLEARRGRSGHAWPFPSRYAAPAVPVRQDSHKPVARDSGS